MTTSTTAIDLDDVLDLSGTRYHHEPRLLRQSVGLTYLPAGIPWVLLSLDRIPRSHQLQAVLRPVSVRWESELWVVVGQLRDGEPCLFTVRRAMEMTRRWAGVASSN